MSEIISLVDNLIIAACNSRASDIHLDPTADGVRVRYRIDGVLLDVHQLPASQRHSIISRIKVLASLQSDEHQAAQDGRFKFGATDIRVSITPTYHGENAVLRLLAKQSSDASLTDLGFNQTDQAKILQAIKHSQGMILVTGPTGSGKTTTLYTLLKLLNQPAVAIVTIEDPIEYAIPGVKQIQVNQRTSLNFASGLRSILRQDPDIIMVGEIRDSDTANIAINAALTGHLLLSTLHTSSAAATLPRLLDMKAEPYLIASTVSLVIGQRLVRRLAPNGYQGRISINEVMVITDDIREAILAKASASDLNKLAVSQGMVTMAADAEEKVAAGLTSRAEVLRVLHD